MQQTTDDDLYGNVRRAISCEEGQSHVLSMTQPKEVMQHSLREHFMDPKLTPNAERDIVIHSRAPTPTSRKISATSPEATAAHRHGITL